MRSSPAALWVSGRATGVKSILPDAHSDYVFAVAAEEGGLLIGSFIICVFAVIVLRALSGCSAEREH